MERARKRKMFLIHRLWENLIKFNDEMSKKCNCWHSPTISTMYSDYYEVIFGVY